jgi:hypothetical protein
MGKTQRKPPHAAVGSTSGRKWGINLSAQNGSYLIAVLVVLIGVWRMSSPLHYLSPSDENLKEVFFGNEPWLILCTNGSSVDSVFEGTSRAHKAVKFGVLDCAAPLPSKKSTFDRLNLNTQVTPPVMFFAAYGRDPKQLSSKLLRNQYALRKELTALTKLHAATVKDSASLHRKCLKKARCALVLAGKPLDEKAIQAVNKAGDASPSFSWVILDSTKVKLRKPSEKDIGLPKYFPGVNRLLLLGETVTNGSSMLEAAPFLGRFDEDGVFPFVNTFAPSGQGKKIDRDGLALLKRKPPTQAYRGESALLCGGNC